MELLKGGDKNYIVLDGTSSSGKSLISSILEKYGYNHAEQDHYVRIAEENVAAAMKNEYCDSNCSKNKLKKELYENVFGGLMKKYPKVVFDVITQRLFDYLPRKNFYIIIVYASLVTLNKNMEIRRLKKNPRDKNVYVQYSERYVKGDENFIDIVNRGEFIKLLISNQKYLFDSEKSLINFANDIFKTMNINDDLDHKIILRDKYQYDHILKMDNKTIGEIESELNNFIK